MKFLVCIILEIDIYELLSFFSDNSFLDAEEIKFYTIYPQTASINKGIPIFL